MSTARAVPGDTSRTRKPLTVPSSGRAAAKAGLPPQFVPHSLRHHFASAALARGIPIIDVSRWLGHRSIDTTHRIYGHIVPSSLDRA